MVSYQNIWSSFIYVVTNINVINNSQFCQTRTEGLRSGEPAILYFLLSVQIEKVVARKNEWLQFDRQTRRYKLPESRREIDASSLIL